MKRVEVVWCGVEVLGQPVIDLQSIDREFKPLHDPRFVPFSKWQAVHIDAHVADKTAQVGYGETLGYCKGPRA